MAILSPRRKRQLLGVVLGTALVSAALGANLVVGVERTALDADTVTESFAEEGVYDDLRTQVVSSMQPDVGTGSGPSVAGGGGGGTVAGIGAPSIDSVAASVVTREYVRTEVNATVDALYAYLHGERDDLALAIDLRPVVDGFATEYEQWVYNASVAELEPDWNVEGLNFSMARMASGESEFRAARQSFEEDQLQRIQEETPRERSREELEAIYDDNRQNIRDESVSRLDSAVAERGVPESLREPVVGYATVGIDALVAEDTSYREFMDEQEQARGPLADAVGAYVRDGVGAEVPETMDLTETMGSDVRGVFEGARTIVWLADLFQYLLPLVAVLVAGLMAYTARRRSRALWRVGGAVAISGLLGFVGATVASTLLSGNLGLDAGETPGIARAFLGVVQTTIGTIGAQSLALLALGLALVAAGIAVRRELLPFPDDPAAE